MKALVLIVSLLGVIGSGFLGYRWYSDMQDPKFQLAKLINPDEAKRLEMSTYALLGGAAIGLISLLALGNKGIPMGLILIVCGAAPLVLSQKPNAGIFTGGLILGGLIALAFLRPRAPKLSSTG